MGQLFQLFGMVDLREMSDEMANLSTQKRQELIEKAAASSKPIGIYSPAAFHVNFRGEIIEIKAGWHEYAAAFAVWALQKYGKGSKYGRTWYTDENGETVDTPELLDEDPAGQQIDEIPVGQLAVKRERKSKIEPEVE